MKVELTVLGGAAAWPNAGQGCSSYLLRSRDTQLLLDCGPDTLLELRKHTRLAGIDAIIVSHCHADHILDLVTLRYALVYSRDRAEERLPLWLPPGGARILEALGQALGSQGETSDDFWGEVFALREYDAARSLKVNDLSIDFSRTQHFTACFAVRVRTADGRTIVYGADTGNIAPLLEFAAGASLLISEATADSHAGVPPESRGHLTPEDAGGWAGASGARRLLISHLWQERAPSEVVRRAAQHFDGPIDIATPGLTLYV